jgi:hypothetical protein
MVSTESSSAREDSKNLLKRISFLQIIDVPFPCELVLKEEAPHAEAGQIKTFTRANHQATREN